jgi:hypothetical protein
MDLYGESVTRSTDDASLGNRPAQPTRSRAVMTHPVADAFALLPL